MLSTTSSSAGTSTGAGADMTDSLPAAGALLPADLMALLCEPLEAPAFTTAAKARERLMSHDSAAAAAAVTVTAAGAHSVGAATSAM
jgi:hypothetical protein